MSLPGKRRPHQVGILSEKMMMNITGNYAHKNYLPVYYFCSAASQIRKIRIPTDFKQFYKIYSERQKRFDREIIEGIITRWH